MQDLTAALPIFESFGSPAVHKLQQQCLADLTDLSGDLHISIEEFGPVRFSLLKDPEEHPVIRRFWKQLLIRQYPSLRKYLLLIASVDAQNYIETQSADLRSSENEFSRVNADRLSAEFAAAHLETEMRKLLLLANVLRPGAISAAPGWILRNAKLVARTEGFYADHLYEAIKAANVANWPTFQELRIRDAWIWLQSSSCIAAGVGKGSLGRAWAALSHTIRDSPKEDSSIQLVWVLMGLEALYAEGNVGVKQQLLAKTELLLGHRERNKKDFGAVYDYRSRLLHGDLDIPIAKSLGFEDSDSFFDELDKKQALALAVLMATLQLMATRSWVKLQFMLSVSGCPSPPSGQPPFES